MFEKKQADRAKVAREYGLSPIDALIKRDEIQTKEFEDAVAGIPVAEDDRSLT